MDHADVVVVTGASAGIGRATAVAFGHRRAKVALLARGIDGLEGAKREVEAAGGLALVIPTDVADAEQVEAAAARAEAILGPIDIWVNAAMVTVYSEFEAITPEEYQRVTEVTYLGTVHGTRAALKRMAPRNHGTIVQVGSALAYRAIPLQSAYCGAKFAIRGFTDSLRSELIHNGVDVHLTMVQLAAFNTPQFEWGRTHRENKPQPLPPIFQPELAARGIVWAASHRRREVWIGSPTVKSIVGTILLPGFLDRYLSDKAYTGQERDEPLPPQRRDNLFEPVPGDHGSHGPFDERAKRFSWQLWATLHKAPAYIAVVLILSALAALVGAGVDAIA